MHPRVQELFEQLCELSREEREKQLNSLDASDHPQLDELRSLLESHDSSDQFLARATADMPIGGLQAIPIAEKPGDSIGRYKLLERIGEGGFGLVYMAQQTEPVRRRVALKIIKVGMDTGQMVARFEAESQALAMMDHPHIARVIDGGATESGRPYFVMELVRGEPVTEYCDRCKMPVRERLQLFQQICSAIEHAHQKGIVHRDIKPSNVLVTVADGKPLVKVIDFGIAKALNVELTDKTLYTEFRQLIGTPQYMSPEQAERSGVDIDTRSDIYSLGVLLYEMLTGTTPVDPTRLRSAAWGQWQKMIAEDEPSRPSAKVSSTMETQADVAQRRSVDAAELSSSLRGDLDWIVLKSIEKDRSRRYATASQFADDIQRHLCDQPVLATPPSKRYLLQKFLRRHRRAVLVSSLLLTSLLVGLAATGVTAVWAMKERAEAIEARMAADRRTQQVRRLAALAGSPLLKKEEADRLASEWAADVELMRSSAKANDPDLVRLECQFATWLAGHAMRYQDPQVTEDALTRTAQLIPQAKSVLTLNDANVLSMLNASIQLRVRNSASSVEIAKLYDDLIPALQAVRGNNEATPVLPEYAARLVEANRDDDAEHVIDEYLRETDGKTIGGLEAARLNQAVNQLSQWGVAHPESYNRLLAFRDSGRVAALSPATDDAELMADFKKMQGTWMMKAGPMTHEMTIEGDQGDVKFIDSNGKIVGRGNAKFSLSRSGAAKLMTRYAIGTDASLGDAVIYKFHGDVMIHAEGLLTGVQNDSTPRLRVWKRVLDQE